MAEATKYSTTIVDELEEMDKERQRIINIFKTLATKTKNGQINALWH